MANNWYDGDSGWSGGANQNNQNGFSNETNSKNYQAGDTQWVDLNGDGQVQEDELFQNPNNGYRNDSADLEWLNQGGVNQNPNGFNQNPNNSYQNGYNQNQGVPNSRQEASNLRQEAPKKKKPNKVVRFVTGLVILLLTLFLLVGIVRLVGTNKPATSESASPKASSQVKTETSEAIKKQTPSSKSEEDLGGSSEASSSEETNDGVSNNATLPSSAVSGEILTNTGTINSIELKISDDLVATYVVNIALGSTDIDVLVNEADIKGLNEGGQVKVSYSKVEGYDKVVIRGLQILN